MVKTIAQWLGLILIALVVAPVLYVMLWLALALDLVI